MQTEESPKRRIQYPEDGIDGLRFRHITNKRPPTKNCDVIEMITNMGHTYMDFTQDCNTLGRQQRNGFVLLNLSKKIHFLAQRSQSRKKPSRAHASEFGLESHNTVIRGGAMHSDGACIFYSPDIKGRDL